MSLLHLQQELDLPLLLHNLGASEEIRRLWAVREDTGPLRLTDTTIENSKYLDTSSGR